ncbi:hypothetical protein EC951288_2777B, partial [Escherichia coli 95.1288]
QRLQRNLQLQTNFYFWPVLQFVPYHMDVRINGHT